jgi:hypothetical protein
VGAKIWSALLTSSVLVMSSRLSCHHVTGVSLSVRVGRCWRIPVWSSPSLRSRRRTGLTTASVILPRSFFVCFLAEGACVVWRCCSLFAVLLLLLVALSNNSQATKGTVPCMFFDNFRQPRNGLELFGTVCLRISVVFPSFVYLERFQTTARTIPN